MAPPETSSELPPHKQWPSAWCNDTLSGRLEAWVRPEDAPLRGKMGFWRMIEERMVRAQIIEEGWRPPPSEFVGMTEQTLIDFEVVRRIGENHRNDATYREISAAFTARIPRVKRPEAFSEEQLARIIELHAGANDELTQSLAQTAAQLLSRTGSTNEAQNTSEPSRTK